MNRILTSTRSVQPRRSLFATLLHSLGHAARMIGDARRLDAMPRDRLDDMGIAPLSDANHRTSAEAGPIPRAQMW